MKEDSDIQSVLDGESEDCIVCADCLSVMADMPESCIDTIVTDPPYGLKFMGKDWDHGVPGEHYWAEALRVAKPGAMLLAFGGTRTHHRLMVAIEDAGWEIRDCLMWLYGSGFPKSLDISKAIDKAAGTEIEVRGHIGYTPADNPGKGVFRTNEERQQPGCRKSAPATVLARQWDGWGTALKPAWEPIILAMKPLDGTFAQNAETHGVAGLNIDGGRIGTTKQTPGGKMDSDASSEITYTGGWGARKPSDSGMNPNIGRWPANLILDEKAAAMLDEQSGETKSSGVINRFKDGMKPFGSGAGHPYESVLGVKDSGGASRFFYCAKASRVERNAGLENQEPKQIGHNLSTNACARCGLRIKHNGSGKGCECGPLRETIKLPTASRNFHPTVKSLALMEYLCKLTATPTGGIVLDPFAGSGTTGMACVTMGRKFIGIEISEEYCEIMRKRIGNIKGPLFK